jgi:hypothetical protein
MMVQLNGLIGLGTAAVVQASTRAGGPTYNYTPNPDNAGFMCRWFGPENFGKNTEAYWDCHAKYYTQMQAPPAPLPPTSMDLTGPNAGIAMDPDAADQVIFDSGEATAADASVQLNAAHVKVYTDSQQAARDAAKAAADAAKDLVGGIPWYVWALLAGAGYIAIKKGI